MVLDQGDNVSKARLWQVVQQWLKEWPERGETPGQRSKEAVNLVTVKWGEKEVHYLHLPRTLGMLTGCVYLTWLSAEGRLKCAKLSKRIEAATVWQRVTAGTFDLLV